MSFWQTGHSVLSLLGRRKTETLGGLGRVSSALVSSGVTGVETWTRHYEHDDDDDDHDDDEIFKRP